MGLGFVVLLGASLAGLVSGILSLALLSPDFPDALSDPRSLYEQYKSASRTARGIMEVGLANQGTLSSLLFLAAAPVALLAALRVSRRYTAFPRDFLGLRWPTVHQALAWTAAALVLRFGLSGFLGGRGAEIGDDSLLDSYRTAFPLPLFYLAIVVAVPVLEEVLFRGFLLEAWRRSRLGIVGAVVLTSALWMYLHSYKAPALTLIFFEGLLLAAARLRTGSTYLTIGIHGLINLLVLIQAGWFLSHHGTEHFVKKGRAHLAEEQYLEAFYAFREAERYADRPCAECRLGIARAYLADGDPREADEARRSRIEVCRAQLQSRVPGTAPAAAEEPSTSGRMKPPEAISWALPPYPETARQRGDRRSVIVETAIDEEGCVTGAQVFRGAAPDLDAAALDAVRRWVFLPATQEGRPMEVRYAVIVEFQTADASP